MSIATVLPYARARMNSLGYEEWTDAFNYNNISSTSYDSTYHLELQTSIGIKNNQNSQDVESPFIVRLFWRGKRDTGENRDTAITAADTIISEFIDPTNRLVGSILKNIVFNSMTIETIAESNDNSIIIRLDFTALVVFDTSQ